MTLPSHRIDKEELLGRLSRARDLHEALSILFDSALEPAGVECALALVQTHDELRGMAAMGWNSAEVARIRIPLENHADPLVEAYLHGERRTVEYAPPIDDCPTAQFYAVPLGHAGDPEGRYALLLVGHHGESWLHEIGVTQQLEVASPLLARLAELDHLRESHAQLKQQRDLLTTIMNALPDPVLISDSDNNILLENRRAEALFTTEDGDSDGRRRAVEINNLLFSSFLTLRPSRRPGASGIV